MYSIKQNVQTTLASLKAYGIKQVVLSPGSRNIPFIQSMQQDSYFQCHVVVDERSAAFYALGLIQQQAEPVVICCTSGTALLNYISAVAEAYYQELPLIVLSADRPMAWVNQMDGQTVEQTSFLSSVTRHMVQLPEIATPQDSWYCQRLLHEALLAVRYPIAGPVQINVPISEPFFDCSATQLPKVTAIDYVVDSTTVKQHGLLNVWHQSSKIWIVVGQHPSDPELIALLQHLAQIQSCVVIKEHLSNLPHDHFISQFDLAFAIEADPSAWMPDLVISLGGHIVSKRLKQLLRRYQPKAHWYVSQRRQFADLFMSVTCWVNQRHHWFLQHLIDLLPKQAPFSRSNYAQRWQKMEQWLQQQVNCFSMDFSDLSVVKQFMQQLPAKSALQLSNSSSVRYAQYYPLAHHSVTVQCNRGTSGIDGCLSTAVGAASQFSGLTFLLIGDLSFFYDVNILLNSPLPATLRILLLNNGGGALFRLLPGLAQSPVLNFITAEHQQQATFLSALSTLNYVQCNNQHALQQQWSTFFDPHLSKPMVLEVVTSAELSTQKINQMVQTIRENYEQNKQKLAIY